MASTMLRQWLMLSMIPIAPRKTTAATLLDELQDRGWELDVRTVQRDLQQLSTVLPLVCDDRSRPYGWSWQSDVVRPWRQRR
ncbi:MAG: hypothetical protein KC502_08960 [Myxococcales bacterium]|nr:hypothetical protein [Myxococcales bacterium]